MLQNLYALILAGGSGERFWPLSRHSRPKHLLPLLAGKTLLESTLARLAGLVALERTLILTTCDQEAAVRALLPQIPDCNIIVEPAKRDTAAAVALGAGLISRRDRSAVIAVLPADQVIQNVAGFQRTLRSAANAAEITNRIVTIGVRPAWACPSYGYIEQGERACIPGLDGDAPAVFEVLGFREKPNPELAESYLRQGSFRWNAGMVVWTVQAILGSLERHVPELSQFMAQLHQTDDCDAVVNSRFASLPKVSLDYAVMEKAAGVLEVEADFDWDDVGGWAAAANSWARDEAGNAAHATVTALVGVHDLIVIRTGDAVLVCNRRDAEKIKKLVGQMPAELQ